MSISAVRVPCASAAPAAPTPRAVAAATRTALQVITAADDVRALVELLQSAERERPVLLASTTGRVDGALPLDALRAELTGRAELRVIATGPATRLLGELIGDLHVYNGAARIYPPPRPGVLVATPARLAPRDGDATQIAAALLDDLDDLRPLRVAGLVDRRTPLLVTRTRPPSDAPASEELTDAETILQLRTTLAQLRAERDQLRSALRERDGDWQPGLFDNAEDAVREAVHRAWVRRIPADAKARLPLPDDWEVGSDLPDSIATATLGLRAKALRCIVDVLVGTADRMPSRGVHPFRQERGPHAAQRRRADGALAYRASIESGVPAAARLIYWRLPDGGIEIATIARHDDGLR